MSTPTDPTPSNPLLNPSSLAIYDIVYTSDNSPCSEEFLTIMRNSYNSSQYTMTPQDGEWAAEWRCKAVHHCEDEEPEAFHNLHLRRRTEEAVYERGDRFRAARAGGHDFEFRFEGEVDNGNVPFLRWELGPRWHADKKVWGWAKRRQERKTRAESSVEESERLGI
jgi:hypothetical protein